VPSTSKKQHNFMAAVANSPKFAKKAGVPTSVGKEFMKADKGRTFKEGGDMKESKAMVKKEIGFMKKAGAPKSMIKHEQAEAKGMKKGGMACSPASMKKTAKAEVKSHEKKMHGMAKGGMAYAKGGVTRADGVVKKGHTKGKTITMKKGGAC
jgi:hypothetical protein